MRGKESGERTMVIPSCVFAAILVFFIFENIQGDASIWASRRASQVRTPVMITYMGNNIERGDTELETQAVASTFKRALAKIQDASSTKPNVPSTSRHTTILSTQAEQLPHTILLIRGYKLEGNRIMERVARFARSCAKASPPIEVWLCLDTSEQKGQAKIAAAYFQHVRVSNVHIHELNADDLTNRFPMLKEAQAGGAPGWADRPAPFGFHTEAIIHWYMHALKSSPQYKAIWVFEADVEYSGDSIVDILYDPTYADDKVDFVTKLCEPKSNPWMHSNAVSKNYDKYMAESERYLSVEPAQMFSRRFMVELQKRLLQGMHVWSEQAGCSFALKAGLKYIPFKEEHMGNPFTYFEAHQFRQPADFEPYRINAHQKNRLYHPVKI
eukprot:m.367300 g.367300  ORF g.367300 m.367300 type:complete len:384 (+) comp20830_c2_seq5:474-1625(+)